MPDDKRRRLQRAGWTEGDAKDLLEPSPQEAAYIEIKVAFARALRKRREARRLTQHELARAVRSSQSRVAKMEAGDPTVTVDLLLRGLLALGASPRDLARVFSKSSDA